MKPRWISAPIPEELISILTREIPDLRDDPECRDACSSVLKELATPGDIEAVCFHEVGHYVESVALGLIVGFEEKDIRFHGPRVIFHPEYQTERFEPCPGSIGTPYNAKQTPFTVKIVKQLANAAVAGGVYACKFANRPRKGVWGDRRAFYDYYRMALKPLHAQTDFLEAREFLRRAVRFVGAELEDSAILQELTKQKASEYKLTYFQPFLAFCGSNTDFGEDRSKTERS